jgi:hypothetical protein
MQIVQLYVEGERVDMFQDESITISDSIANVKDISKIYTTYSRQFTLPASKTNNRIFKHYYNFDITENTFDARFRVSAYLNVNGIRYKDGKLRLSGVKLKDNQADSYQVTFFGNAVSLKDKLGEDTLSSLTGGTYGLENYNHDYENTTVRQSFTNASPLFSGDIKYSFISHTRVFQYDGVSVKTSTGSPTYPDYYVGLTDLKPSIRLKCIIDAIEEKYNLDFSQYFWNTAYFRNLYMWLHKEAGVMTQAADQNQLTTFFSDSSIWVTVGTDQRVNGQLVSSDNQFEPAVRYLIESYKVSTTPVDYTLEIYNNGTATGFPIFRGTASGTFTFNTGALPYPLGGTQTHELSFKIISDTVFTPTSQDIVIQKQVKNSYGQWVDSGTAVTYSCTSGSVTASVNVPEQMPEMKVYDFLINLFKMHLLTSSISTELNGDETVEVLPLNDYYSTGAEHDITKYIDVKETQVERLMPYKEIKFSYKGRKSALITAYDEAYPNDKFGDLNWNSGTDDMDGESYSVDIGFEHMYFERIRSSGGTLSSVQYGLMTDKELKPIVGLPLIHSIILRTGVPSGQFRWNNGNGTQTVLTNYNAPTNIDADGKSIHWGAQFNEWDEGQEDYSLYNRFYSDYISAIFQKSARKLTYKAFLPLGVLLTYQLRDRFRIGQHTFKIDSVNTNLQTQESTLVLYNELPTLWNPTKRINLVETVNAGRTENVRLGTPSLPAYVKLEWDKVDNATEYFMYENGEYIAKVVPSGSKLESYEFTTLDKTVSNVLSVQAYFGTVGAFNGLVTPLVSITG